MIAVKGIRTYFETLRELCKSGLVSHPLNGRPRLLVGRIDANQEFDIVLSLRASLLRTTTDEPRRSYRLTRLCRKADGWRKQAFTLTDGVPCQALHTRVRFVRIMHGGVASAVDEFR
jgi:hypothetical protein